MSWYCSRLQLPYKAVLNTSFRPSPFGENAFGATTWQSGEGAALQSAIIMERCTVSVPQLRRIAAVTVYKPGISYRCAGFSKSDVLPVTDKESPKFQWTVYRS